MENQTKSNALELDMKIPHKNPATNYSENNLFQFEHVKVKEERNENLFEELEYTTKHFENPTKDLDPDIKLEAALKDENDSKPDVVFVPLNSNSLKIEAKSIREPLENPSNIEQNEFEYKNYLKINPDSFESRFECIYCDYKTHFKQYFVKHAKTVHFYKNAPTNFQCQECLYKTTAQYKLNRHIKIKHNPDQTINKCPHCNYETNWNYILRNHIASMHGDAGFNCPHCSHVSKWKTNLRKHIIAKHSDHCDPKWLKNSKDNKKLDRKEDGSAEVSINTNNIGYTCIYCDHKTKWRGSMSKHVKMKHNLNCEVYFCQHCPYSTKDKHSLKLHNRKRHQEHPRNFQCPHCSFTTSEKVYIKQHIGRKHTENKDEMQCLHCPFVTKTRSYFLHHLNAAHFKRKNVDSHTESRAPDSDTNLSNGNPTSSYFDGDLFFFDSLNFEEGMPENSFEQIRYPGDIINDQAKSITEYPNIIGNIREDMKPQNPNIVNNMKEMAEIIINNMNEESELDSKSAGDAIRNESNVETTEIKMDMVINDVDDIDNTVPDIPEYLTLDTLEPSSDITPAKNPIPDEKFDWTKFLRLNNDTLECSACSYKTQFKPYFSKHVRTVHNKISIPKFQCKECSYVTTAGFKLNRHNRNKHNTNNIYKCPHCDYVAKWNYKLQSHIKQKHEGKNIGFKCPYCSHVNHYKANLKRHITLKHINKGMLDASLSDDNFEIKQENIEDEINEVKQVKNEDQDEYIELKHENTAADCQEY